MRRVIRAVALVWLMALAVVAGSPAPARACTCVPGSVAGLISDADAVYIARPRAVDFFPGASFRVLRVLKGPIRSNLRVKVAGGDEAACGTSIPQVDYVIVSPEGGSPRQLNLCNEYLRGKTAVREAESILGTGRSPPRRPDPAWISQWLLMLAAASAAALARRRLARATDEPPPPESI